jgi:hypothetical protein
MDIDPKSQLRVTADYQAPFPNPIRVKTGDVISLDRTVETDIPGWVWGADRAGVSGWVPESYIEPQGDNGVMRCGKRPGWTAGMGASFPCRSSKTNLEAGVIKAQALQLSLCINTKFMDWCA